MLGDTIWDTWDLVAENATQTPAGFEATMNRFIAKYIKPTDFGDQQHYIDNYQRPKNYKPRILGERFQTVTTKYMPRFPGSNGNNPYAGTQGKLAYF